MAQLKVHKHKAEPLLLSMPTTDLVLYVSEASNPASRPSGALRALAEHNVERVKSALNCSPSVEQRWVVASCHEVGGASTPPSSGRSKGRFAPFRPPLMSNVRSRRFAAGHVACRVPGPVVGTSPAVNANAGECVQAQASATPTLRPHADHLRRSSAGGRLTEVGAAGHCLFRARLPVQLERQCKQVCSAWACRLSLVHCHACLGCLGRANSRHAVPVLFAWPRKQLLSAVLSGIAAFQAPPDMDLTPPSSGRPPSRLVAPAFGLPLMSNVRSR